jgi:O-antigen/teichoic acid export membrane protein
MRIRVRFSDHLWNYAGTIFRLANSFLLLPFLIYFLDASILGLWYVFLAINGFVSLFQFGFSPSFARSIAYAFSGVKSIIREGRTLDFSDELDYYFIKKVILICNRVYRIIAIIALLVMVSIGTMYIIYISSELAIIDYMPAWIVFCTAVFLNLYYLYYESLLRGTGSIAELNKATIVSSCVQMVLSIGCLWIGLGVLSAAVGLLFQGLTFRLLCRRSFYKVGDIGLHLKQCGIPIERKELSELFSAISYNAFKDGAVSVANYMMTQAGSIVCSLFLTLAETGIYSVTFQLVNAVANVSASMSVSYLPALQSAFAIDDKGTARTIISKITASYCLIFPICLALVILIGIPVFQFIKPTYEFDTIVFLGLGCYLFLWKQQSMFASYIASTNRIPYSRSFIVAAVLGVLLSFLFVGYFKFGVWGLILGQAVAQILYNNWRWVVFVCSELDISYFALIKCGMKTWFAKAKSLI